jgi:hypothetical protein
VQTRNRGRRRRRIGNQTDKTYGSFTIPYIMDLDLGLSVCIFTMGFAWAITHICAVYGQGRPRQFGGPVIILTIFHLKKIEKNLKTFTHGQIGIYLWIMHN